MMLSTLIVAPLIGALVTALLPKQNESLIKIWATIVSGVTMVASLVLWANYNPGGGLQFEELYRWIPNFNVAYHVGVDGMSLPLVVLSTVVAFLAVLASFSIKDRVKEYFALLLLLEVGMIGVFLALDFVLFYVFWEIVLLPMYFLIGIWGGARREYAAIKFFIYTLVGSTIMLVAFLALYFMSGADTFNLLQIGQYAANLSTTAQWWIFLGLFIGFAVKVPAFPFHTWLPDAHVEAPTPISMILAGVLLKMGTYAMLRISHGILPDAAASFANILMVLALINIVYGAFAAMNQKDMKKMVAYSSVNHMGFFLLGLAAGTPQALNGAMYVNISHGLISALFFFVVGMLYERTHTREIAKLGGMFLTVPVISTAFAFVAFANLGLPTLAGFISEFFVLLGSYPRFGMLLLVAGLGMVITAAFHLMLMRRVLMGNKMPEWEGLQDISAREVAIFTPLAVLTILFGVWPAPLFDILEPAAQMLAQALKLI